MNAKELRAMAEKSRAWYTTPNIPEACHQVPDHVFYTGYHLATYILATVRDDDDEPVTAEWLHSLFWDSNSAWWYLDKTRQKVVICEHGKPADVWVASKPFALSDVDQDSLLCEVTSRGQFRSLCRGLGIELKEGGK